MSITIKYYSFNPNIADEKWKNFQNDHNKAEKGDLEEGYLDDMLENLACAEDKEEQLHYLKLIDLYYGSVCDYDVQEPRLAGYFVEAIMEAVDLEYEPINESKENWIKVFSQMDADLFNKITAILMKKMNWEEEETKSGLMEFLKGIRPIVIDLKESKESFLAVNYNDDGFDQEKIEQIFNERALVHFESFKNLFELSP